MTNDRRFKTDTIWHLYRAIWRVTARQQLVLIGLSLIVAVLAAAPLKFQQLVVSTPCARRRRLSCRLAVRGPPGASPF
jgi:hypothetical protein